ncbi:MAG: transposase [Saprospiraceae bacterium]|nr:transposase [Saprospiraceae bacterium]
MKQVYGLIERLSEEFAVDGVCALLEVSRSCYYDFRAQKTYQAGQRKQEQAGAVAQVFWTHKRRYGQRRIVAELQAKGLKIGRHRVRTLMQSQELLAIQPKSFEQLFYQLNKQNLS